jgi:hypothetical protein
VPAVISCGIFIERSRVEFSPGTVGSGEKDIDVNLNRETPFEQSVTDPVDIARNKEDIRIRNILSIKY